MKKVVYVISCILLIMLLVACSNNDEKLELEQVKISVKRTGNLLTGIGKVKVYIDDEKVMEIKNDHTETINMALSPGIHTIQIKGQGDKSDVEEFEVVAGANNIFLFNTEISSIYGVKLTLLNADNTKNEMQEDSQDEVTEESDTQQTQEEAVNNKEEVISNNKEVTNTNKVAQQQTTVSKRYEYIQKLNNIEESLADLDYLYENGITSEMKEAESITYERWDDALNEIYGVLKTQLSTNEMDALRQEQRKWIIDRDNMAEADSLEFEGGTMESLQYVSTLAQMTKDRCYELVTIYMK